MLPRIFTEEWARAWCDALNANEIYLHAAAQWEGAVALVMRADPVHEVTADRAVYLDLWHGTCRDARVATGADLETAPYILEANPPTWLELLAGRLSPVMALLGGRLRLTRGNLASLLPYANAAKELVSTAAQIHAQMGEAGA